MRKYVIEVKVTLPKIANVNIIQNMMRWDHIAGNGLKMIHHFVSLQVDLTQNIVQEQKNKKMKVYTGLKMRKYVTEVKVTFPQIANVDIIQNMIGWDHTAGIGMEMSHHIVSLPAGLTQSIVQELGEKETKIYILD